MKTLIVDSYEEMMQRCSVSFVALMGLLPFVLAACTDASSSVTHPSRRNRLSKFQQVSACCR
jgi:hypothetical protein